MSAAAVSCHFTDVVLYDCETTGLSTQQHDIVQFAALPLVGGERIGSYCSDVKLHRFDKVPQKAYEVHGIGWKRLKNAPVWGDVWAGFVKWLDIVRHPHTRVLLVAHNGKRYDAPMVQAHCKRWGVVVPDWILWGDSLPVCRELYPKAESHKLEAMFALVCQADPTIKASLPTGVSAHDALYDTAMLRAVVCAGGNAFVSKLCTPTTTKRV